MDKIAIIGPGSIGGFLAVAFSIIGKELTCVASDRSAPLLAENGLTISSPLLGTHTIHLTPTSQLTSPQDLIVISTKAYDLNQAMQAITPAAAVNAVLLPLLNGIEHIRTLRETFPEATVIPAIIGNIEVKRESPVKLEHTNRNARIQAAAPVAFEPTLHSLFSAAGIEYVHHESESAVLWDKLIRLNALACTTALSGLTVGEILQDSEWRSKLAQAVDEATRIAGEDGYDCSSESVMRAIENLPPHISTSLARDVEAGAATEIDAIAGAIIRRGQQHGIPTPTISHMHDAIVSNLYRETIR